MDGGYYDIRVTHKRGRKLSVQRVETITNTRDLKAARRELAHFAPLRPGCRLAIIRRDGGEREVA